MIRHSLTLIAFSLGTLLLGCQSSEPTRGSNGTPNGTVTIEVVQDGKTLAFVVDDVVAGTTVEELLRGLDAIEVEISGSGTTAFVHSIGGQAPDGNEGWMFQIDGEFASQGVGSTKVEPPTTITWEISSL